MRLAEIDANKNETGNFYYFDTQNGNVYESEFVEKTYKNLVNQGYKTVDDAIADGAYTAYTWDMDDDSYIKKLLADEGVSSADDYVKKLLTDEGVTSATTADEFESILKKFISQHHNTQKSILKMAALGAA